MPDRSLITGLVLAGGRGSRMGGVDKGLQLHLGKPLALFAAQRLVPQVGSLMLNANRNFEAYAAFGFPVWPDSMPDFPGPLGGFLAGLEHCPTPWLATVPCDTPDFPLDLVARLVAALELADADIAVAHTPPREDGRGHKRLQSRGGFSAEGEPPGSRREPMNQPEPQTQPVFCLMKRELRGSLANYMAQGGRKIDVWAKNQRCAAALFEDDNAFFNANTVEDLQRLQAAG